MCGLLVGRSILYLSSMTALSAAL